MVTSGFSSDRAGSGYQSVVVSALNCAPVWWLPRTGTRAGSRPNGRTAWLPLMPSPARTPPSVPAVVDVVSELSPVPGVSVSTSCVAVRSVGMPSGSNRIASAPASSWSRGSPTGARRPALASGSARTASAMPHGFPDSARRFWRPTE